VGGESEILEAVGFVVELEKFRSDALGVVEVGVLRHPVIALFAEEMRQVEEVGGAGAVVEPEDAEEIVLPAEFSPVAQRTRGQLGELMAEVFIHQGNDAGIAVGFLVLSEDFKHDDAGPPVVVGGGADHAAGGLVGERPIDIFLSLGFEACVFEQISEGEKAVEEVRAAFPGLAGAAEPAAVGADV
jgi:hypothetical protein